MSSLTPFWKHLESRAGQGVVKGEWAQGRPLPHALAGVMVSSGDRCITYPGPRPHDPPLRVVRHLDGSLVGVSDDDPSLRIDLDAEDVVVLRAQSGAVRKKIALALGIQPSRRPAAPLPGVLHVGLLEPAPSVAYPVVLVCHPQAAVVGTLVQEAVLADKRPTLVLTPTDDAWTDELREWVEGRGGTLVPADDVVDATDSGEWAATELWSLSRARFLKRSGFNAKAVRKNTRKGGGGRDKALRAHSVSVGKVLRTLIGNQRAHARNELNKGVVEIRLPRIGLNQIATLAGGGCKKYHITRIRKSGKYAPLVKLLDALNDVEKLRALRRR